MTPQDPTIEPLRANRIDAALACARLVWPVAYDELLPPGQVEHMLSSRASRENLLGYLDASDRGYHLAVADDEVVGYVSFHLLDPTVARLEQLYVLPEWWGRGVARRLVDVVLKAARTAGRVTVDLTVNRGNARALAFYRGQGFEVVGEQVVAIGGGFEMDDLVMARPVT